DTFAVATLKRAKERVVVEPPRLCRDVGPEQTGSPRITCPLLPLKPRARSLQRDLLQSADIGVIDRRRPACGVEPTFQLRLQGCFTTNRREILDVVECDEL